MNATCPALLFLDLVILIISDEDKLMKVTKPRGKELKIDRKMFRFVTCRRHELGLMFG
jgi:hypothetical protein